MLTNRWKTLTLQFCRIDVALFLVCVVFFLLWPETDLTVTTMFWDGEQFFLADNWFIRTMYQIFAKIHGLYLLVFIVGLIFAYKKKNVVLKTTMLFLLVSILLGPGILVNAILKENSVGRPRPVHIQEYGGNDVFSPVFHYSGACQENCSFVSGHASIGFYLMALAWVFRRRSLLFAGIALGALVGFGRIVQGGHFLSDVIFAGWATYYVCLLCALYYKLPLTFKTKPEAT